MKKIASMIAALALYGCAYNVTLMPRDSGKTYSGELNSSGTGSGTMSVNLDGTTCSGPVAKVASGETFGFANTYGQVGGKPVSAFSTMTSSGDVTVKAILSCTNGSGLRCDITGRGASAGGLCLDDKGKVYDILAIRK